MQVSVRGNVRIACRIENLGDFLNMRRGFFGPDMVHGVDVPDALVAPATSCLALPARFVAQLKLQRRETRKTRTTTGFAYFGIYEPVRLIVLDRECSVDVLKVPDECPVLIGELPLRLLDLVIAPDGKSLVGNPAHDGHLMADLA
jgi:hypothetical protein